MLAPSTPVAQPPRPVLRLRTLALCLGLGLYLTTLPGGAAPASAKPATALPMRLPGDVVPTAVLLALTVDPAQPSHSGTVDIRLQLLRPTRSIRLHAKDMALQQAWLEVGAQRLPAQVRRLDDESLALQFKHPVPAGAARLSLAFTGRLQDKDVSGLFRRFEPAQPIQPGQPNQAGQPGAWYAMTQFESTGARLAFPAFDEPGWKLPWTLTLTVPQALLAVSNMPALPALPNTPDPAPPGWKTVRFAPTPPLPSYLLAFAVGPFEVVGAGSTGPTSQTPLRIITPQGRTADAVYAARNTAAIVERLEAYFGLPHPYPKLDSLALAGVPNYGAMEHPGLVTYGPGYLLAPAVEQTTRFERNYTALAAHELAHQWFGNLVTMAWWDDLWLNESFASWMGDRITHELQPGWGWDTAVQLARRAAMATDKLLSSRRVAEPVDSYDALASVWDSITYDKGQTVLAMLEHWLGPEPFRAGVQRYLQRHAWGNATALDFSNALAEQHPALPAALHSFTHQAGIPRVSVQLLCDSGPPRLRLLQSRLLLLGSEAAAAAKAKPLWHVPMVLRTPGGLTRTLLASPEATVALPDATCPAWVQANAGGLGYYRVAYPPHGLGRLLAQADLPLAERLSLLDDAQGLSEAGDLPLRELHALAQANAAHPDRRVAEQALALLLSTQRLVAPGQQAAAAARWQTAFGNRARALGWLPRSTDTEDDRLLRRTLLPALANWGDDSALRTQALALTRQWLLGRNAAAGLAADQRASDQPSTGAVQHTNTLDPSLRAAVLGVAAIDGDSALFNALRSALDSSTLRQERLDLLGALARFRNPALAERARALLLDPALDIREVRWPLQRAHNQDPVLRDGLLAFLQQHHAELVQRLGRDEPAGLPGATDQACSRSDADRIHAVFAPHAARFQGGQLALAQALESVRLCAAWREQADGALDAQ